MCVTPETAEDLVQETLARVMKRPRLLRSEDDIGYLLRALRNTFVSDTRFAPGPPEAPVPPDELYRAIASLPDGLRDVLVAVDLMGLSHGEARRALRVRKPTLATRLHRGRQRVAEMLESGS